MAEKKETAIKVENVSKIFRIPHEKISSVRGVFVNALKKKNYEEFKALDNVSFEVKKGEFFGIIGRNGSGKSTLLKILAGIYEADKGKIRINGMISPFLELGIGFNPELSGRDNIYLNATVLGMTQKQIDKKFDSIVAFSELERFIDQKLKNYSSGMQVRLAFSVSIHANRDILLMDEVLAVGDSNFQAKCLEEFRKIKKMGKTIIFVSHDAETVKEFCDRAMLLNEGEVVITAGPERAVFEYGKVLMDSQKKLINEKAPEKKIKPKQKIINKKNHIRSIKTFNGKGDETNVFENGEDITVRLELKIDEIEEDMYVSVGVFDKITDAVVCGNNMFFEKVDKKWEKGVNIVDLVFKDNPFQRGDFYISSYFFKGDPKDNHFYDYYHGKEKGEYIKIIPRTKHQGLTYLPHEWKI